MGLLAGPVSEQLALFDKTFDRIESTSIDYLLIIQGVHQDDCLQFVDKASWLTSDHDALQNLRAWFTYVPKELAKPHCSHNCEVPFCTPGLRVL